jgi:ATP-binding cassette subfamily C protein CydC
VFISGGEAQRLALARALLADFEVLIVDEPTSNVDQETGLGLVKDLLQIARQGSNRAILLITHDSELAQLADRAIKI